MRNFILLLSFCCSITAFSAAFSPKRFVSNKISSSTTRVSSASEYQQSAAAILHNRHFLVPRGGQVENESDANEVIDLDNASNHGGSEEEQVFDLHQDDQDTNDNQMTVEPLAEAASSTSLPIMNILSTIGLAIQTAGSSYSSALTAYPILTKSLTAGVTFFLSDFAAQRIERPKVPTVSTPETKSSKTKSTKKSRVRKGSSKDNKSKISPGTPLATWKYDWTRTLTSCLVGFLYFGPAAHYWYEWIFSVLPGTSLVSTLQKAILGQLLFGPSFTCIFFAASLMQAGQFNVQNWVQKIKRDLPGAWISGSAFWPLVDLISYSVVPVKFIPLFINLCSFVWTVYLSMVANRLNSSDAKV